jgi:MFS family permease
MAAWRPFVLVLLPFAAGYYLSYVFRTINALIAGALTSELGLSPADLGLLTSVYFLAMAAVQIPLGVLLDRYGPRRVQSGCLVSAVAGAAIFGCATSMPALMLGRALIGLGFSAALMASLKAIVLWFPKERIAFANGWVVMLGALGAVTATLPAESLVATLGWRTLFMLLAAATGLCALAIFSIVPDAAVPMTPVSGFPSVRLRDIYRDARFLRLAPLSTACIGSAWSLQGLWTAPWLEHVEGLARPEVVRHLLVMGVALSLAALLLGWGADQLRRRGINRETFLAGVAILFITAQLALAMRLPLPAYIPWAIIAAVGAATVLSFAILAEYFPKEMSARANAALNILHLAGAFLLQYLMGVVVSFWPPEAGHPPAEAYQAAVGLGAILQCSALLWFLMAARGRQSPVFRAAQPVIRASAVPWPANVVDYAGAQSALAYHVARARSQAAHWRRIGVASGLLCLCLAATLAVNDHSHFIAYVVELPSAASAMSFDDGAPSHSWEVAQVLDACAQARVAGPPLTLVGIDRILPVTCDGRANPHSAEQEMKTASYGRGL